MFKLLGFVLKVTVFSALVLVIGNMVHWGGRTVSDQVRLQISHAERGAWTGVDEIKHWAGKLTGDTKAGAAKKRVAAKNTAAVESAEDEPAVDAKNVPPSERQKLRALIDELNHSATKD